jgi:UDP-glucuronate decarboxylase
VFELTGSKSRGMKMPLPIDDPMQRLPDIGLAKERLGWQPKIELREGLGNTIAYFEALLARQSSEPARG